MVLWCGYLLMVNKLYKQPKNQSPTQKNDLPAEYNCLELPYTVADISCILKLDRKKNQGVPTEYRHSQVGSLAITYQESAASIDTSSQNSGKGYWSSTAKSNSDSKASLIHKDSPHLVKRCTKRYPLRFRMARISPRNLSAVMIRKLYWSNGNLPSTYISAPKMGKLKNSRC